MTENKMVNTDLVLDRSMKKLKQMELEFGRILYIPVNVEDDLVGQKYRM